MTVNPSELFSRIKDAAKPPPEPQRIWVEVHGARVAVRPGPQDHLAPDSNPPGVAEVGAWQTKQGYTPDVNSSPAPLAPGEHPADRFREADTTARTGQPDPPDALPGKVIAPRR